MKQALKRQSLRALLPWILVLAVLAAALLGVSGKGLFLILRGPKPLESQDPAELKGEYLSFDASQVIVAFATLTSTSEDGDSETLKTYYLLPAGDGTYLAVMDKKEAHEAKLSGAMEQSHDYYLGDLTELTPLGIIQGTAGDLEEDMTEYMVDCIEKYALPGYTQGGDTAALVRPVQVNLCNVGLLSGTWTLVLGIGGLSCLLGAILLLALALSGVFQRRVLGQLSETPEEADRLFADALALERVRAGRYLWYQKGAFTRVLDPAELVWGYPEPEPLVVSKYRWPVALYDVEGNKTLLGFQEKKNRDKLLETVAAQGYPFVLGYNPALSQKYAQDRESFLTLARQAAAERAGQKEEAL